MKIKCYLNVLCMLCGIVWGRAQQQPNIIFIMADDLGYSDLGCYGNDFNETPSIDSLAGTGTRFTSAYTAAPVCSPSRAALMSGQYPARLGINDYLRPDTEKHLDTALITLPEMLKKAGYRTGIVGKWHLSGYRLEGAPEETLPGIHGFDEVMVSENRGIGAGSYFYPYHFNRDISRKLSGEKEFLVDRQHEEALEFMRRNRDRPFFLMLSHYAVHTYVHGKPELVAYFQEKEGASKSAPHKDNPENNPYKKWPEDFRGGNNNPHLAAQLLSIDRGVGKIMYTLKELGLDRNTIVIFTSDNGGETNVTDNTPLRGGKSMLYEGGVKVPLIIADLRDSNALTGIAQPVANYDFYPTMADWAGGTIPGHMDGKSMVSLLKAKKRKQKRSFYWHYPLKKRHFLGGRSSGSIRHGDWKLIEFFDTGKYELYNLKDDPGEQNNLVHQSPEKAHRLQKRLAQWRKEVLKHE
ncbi:sulfatase [Sinomicrobium soli]|uniref:sulfatase n=1 Tax=Sinomicrobium sp. N-1-3-6 TaxID=2219864 RepID=UPI000DCB0F6A|nr:sulfatase [Sinomicrobium sp. N-1-3-6]RAV28208.1 sulfatase [Sinomicrobium sp. N-1-3-6]